jgi:hypothetical protein
LGPGRRGLCYPHTPVLSGAAGFAARSCQVATFYTPRKSWQSGKDVGQVFAAQGVPTLPLLAPRGKVAPRWQIPPPPQPRLLPAVRENSYLVNRPRLKLSTARLAEKRKSWGITEPDELKAIAMVISLLFIPFLSVE